MSGNHRIRERTGSRSTTNGDEKSQNSYSVALRKGSSGRGRPKIIREDHFNPGSPLDTPGKAPDGNLGPLTISTDRMTDTELRRAIQDTKNTDQELLIRDENGKVPANSNTNLEDNLETTELELASNLYSSTEIETDIIAEEEKYIHRSKRLTKIILMLDIITPLVMITGNTVKKLNWDNTPSQSDTKAKQGNNRQA